MLKSIRSWFFSIFLILFSTIIFYIVIEIYLKYFLDSLKVIKERLKMIIKSKNSLSIENPLMLYNYEKEDHSNDNKIEHSLFKVLFTILI